MLTADETTLLLDRNAHESFPGLRSIAKNYRLSIAGCKPCGARKLPMVEQAFKSYVLAIKSNVLFRKVLEKLFGTRVPNIRGLQ